MGIPGSAAAGRLDVREPPAVPAGRAGALRLNGDPGLQPRAGKHPGKTPVIRRT